MWRRRKGWCRQCFDLFSVFWGWLWREGVLCGAPSGLYQSGTFSESKHAVRIIARDWVGDCETCCFLRSWYAAERGVSSGAKDMSLYEPCGITG
ncbi:hypothetical protein B0J18DRAFT_421949 [Chaetomium sp. MPI-SDFR-AT-0129]|nr:hypothetical protein B0J18DRAFT_421949 [Chaetomium sp. MPI-SDFR-AT-0129]